MSGRNYLIANKIHLICHRFESYSNMLVGILNCLILIVLGFLIVFATSPIHAVISLILIFCDAAFILFNFGFDFLGLVFIIIYVGAIAVLFLFIVMMMNLKPLIKNKNSLSNKFILVSIFILTFLIYACFGFIYSFEDFFYNDFFISSYSLIDIFNTIDVFGIYFYNFFNIYFLLAGVILLIALIGAIVLTVDSSGVKTSIPQIELKQLAKSSNILTFYKN